MNNGAEATIGTFVIVFLIFGLVFIGVYVGQTNIINKCDQQGYFQTSGKAYVCKPAKVITNVVAVPNK